MGSFIGLWEGFSAGGGPIGPGGVGSTQGPRRILLNATAGDVIAGGEGAGGDVRLVDSDGLQRIHLDATGEEGPSLAQVRPPISIRGDGSIHAGSTAGAFGSGGVSADGSLNLYDVFARQRVTLVAGTADLSLKTDAGDRTVHLRASDGTHAGLWAGGGGRSGLLVVQDSAGTNRIDVAGGGGRITLRDSTGKDRAMMTGGGSIDLSDEEGDVTLKLRGQDETRSGLWAGGGGRNGVVVTRNAAGKNRQSFDASNGEMRVYSDDGNTRIKLSGNGASGWFGGDGQAGDVLLFSSSADNTSSAAASIWLQGSTGDIVLRNADCAEEFEVRLGEDVGPGAVLVLDERGGMALCTEAYDSCVAGVVSGADGVRPGIVLGRVPGAKNRWPIALAGKVMCNVDASFGPIKVGSLLTTSTRPGYAMVATDRERAFGAVIGKAMAPLASGTGSVPVLVGLQ